MNLKFEEDGDSYLIKSAFDDSMVGRIGKHPVSGKWHLTEWDLNCMNLATYYIINIEIEELNREGL